MKFSDLRVFVKEGEVPILLATFKSDRSTTIATITLVSIVAAVIAAYAVAAYLQDDYPVADSLYWAIGLTEDGSMAEIVSYGIAFMASFLFFVAFLENRAPSLLFASLLMAFIWFDDSAQYHERLGGELVTWLDLPPLAGLRPQDIGELLAWSMAALGLGVVLLRVLLKRQPGDLGVLIIVSMVFGLLVFFGVVADMVNIIIEPHCHLTTSVIEDGGEMIAVALLGGIALGFSRNGKTYFSLIYRKQHPE